MKTEAELDADMAPVKAELDSLLASTQSLRDERDSKKKQAYALTKEAQDLSEQVNAIHGTRLQELKNRYAKLARAKQAIRDAKKRLAQLS